MYNVIKPTITYGFGKDYPVSPTYEMKTPKGNTCKVYICSEFNPESFNCCPVGYNYKLIWHSYGNTFYHSKEINTITDKENIQDVVDDFIELYGRGRMYILQDEIVVSC